MVTNSNSKLIAASLNGSKGFAGLIIRKQGAERGPKGNKKVFGDDQIHTVIVTGFRYDNLVKKSLDALNSITDESICQDATAKNLKDKDGNPISLTDVADARAELVQSFNESLAGTNESTTDAVYEPLVVDGETVRGARVYKCVKAQGIPCKCRDCSGDARQPVDGTIYLSGLNIWSKVLVPAANGPVPEAASKAKTIAKNLLRSKLPVRKFVSYRLEKGGEWILKAGGSAELEATKNGFVVTDQIVDLLEKASA
jgi:hypothetical protein